VKILLFGRNGQVGWELQRALAPLGELHALGTRRAPTSPIRSRSPRRCARSGPTWSSTPRRYTAVDRAEAEPAWRGASTPRRPRSSPARRPPRAPGWSTTAPTTSSTAAATHPRGEDAPTGPLNVYGRPSSKASRRSGRAARGTSCLRTSWVYGTRGGNFARTMLRLAQERDRLAVIDDQVGAPTGAELIADVTRACDPRRRRRQRRRAAPTTSSPRARPAGTATPAASSRRRAPPACR
jgi:dTDP-4-dehydrorhamnose reductase